MPGNNNEIEKRLWEVADQLRANSRLKSSEKIRLLDDAVDAILSDEE